MPYKDKEAKRRRDKEYRAENAEKVKATKRAYQIANREKINAAANRRYHENPDGQRIRSRKWEQAVIARTGVHPSTKHTRAWRARDPEAYREYNRAWMREAGKVPEVRARRSAKTCLVYGTDLKVSDLPKDLVEAKAAQLLLKRRLRETGNVKT